MAERDFVAGPYSIADMAIYPWVLQYEKQGMTLDDFPNVAAWLTTIGERAAVIRAYEKGERIRPSLMAVVIVRLQPYRGVPVLHKW